MDNDDDGEASLTTHRIPRKLLFISLPMFNSTAMKLWISFTAFIFFIIKKHKNFYEEQFINQLSGSSNHGASERKHTKKVRINKSSRGWFFFFCLRYKNIKSRRRLPAMKQKAYIKQLSNISFSLPSRFMN